MLTHWRYCSLALSHRYDIVMPLFAAVTTTYSVRAVSTLECGSNNLQRLRTQRRHKRASDDDRKGVPVVAEVVGAARAEGERVVVTLTLIWIEDNYKKRKHGWSLTIMAMSSLWRNCRDWLHRKLSFPFHLWIGNAILGIKISSLSASEVVTFTAPSASHDNFVKMTILMFQW